MAAAFDKDRTGVHPTLEKEISQKSSSTLTYCYRSSNLEEGWEVDQRVRELQNDDQE